MGNEIVDTKDARIVWLVTDLGWDTEKPLRAFSNKEDAEQYCSEYDSKEEERATNLYRVAIDADEKPERVKLRSGPWWGGPRSHPERYTLFGSLLWLFGSLGCSTPNPQPFPVEPPTIRQQSCQIGADFVPFSTREMRLWCLVAAYHGDDAMWRRLSCPQWCSTGVQ